MRTTVDIPEDLLRRVKAVAALRGIKLKDLIAGFLEQGLATRQQELETLGQKRPVPVTIPPAGRKIVPFTNAEMDETFRTSSSFQT
jgi:hypothetical protein